MNGPTPPPHPCGGGVVRVRTRPPRKSSHLFGHNGRCGRAVRAGAGTLSVGDGFAESARGLAPIATLLG